MLLAHRRAANYKGRSPARTRPVQGASSVCSYRVCPATTYLDRVKEPMKTSRANGPVIIPTVSPAGKAGWVAVWHGLGRCGRIREMSCGAVLHGFRDFLSYVRQLARTSAGAILTTETQRLREELRERGEGGRYAAPFMEHAACRRLPGCFSRDPVFSFMSWCLGGSWKIRAEARGSGVMDGRRICDTRR